LDYHPPPVKKFALVNGNRKDCAMKRGPALVQRKKEIKFEQVLDIEENIWTPTIGIKGRIDVSFKVCCDITDSKCP